MSKELFDVLKQAGYDTFQIDGSKWPKPPKTLGPWTGGVTLIPNKQASDPPASKEGSPSKGEMK